MLTILLNNQINLDEADKVGTFSRSDIKFNVSILRNFEHNRSFNVICIQQINESIYLISF